METSRLRDELVVMSDHAWQRLSDRLEGLTDEEYLWEPAPGCWPLRPGPAGTWTCDFAWPEPDPAPITTIGWRLSHPTVNDDRFRPWLGLTPLPDWPPQPVPTSGAVGCPGSSTPSTS